MTENLHQDTFIPDLEFGVKWQVEIANRFTDAGLSVTRLDDDPSAARARSGPTKEFEGMDDFDVEGWPIEVKTMRKIRYTSPENVPFRMIRFGQVEQWNRKTVWPLAVIMVSGPTGAAIVLPVRPTHQDWSQETIWVRGYAETMYAAPRHWFRPFEGFVKWLRSNPNLEGKQ